MDSRGQLLSPAMLLKRSSGNQGTGTLSISWELVEILAHSQPYPRPTEAERVLGRIPRGLGHGLVCEKHLLQKTLGGHLGSLGPE